MSNSFRTCMNRILNSKVYSQQQNDNNLDRELDIFFEKAALGGANNVAKMTIEERVERAERGAFLEDEIFLIVDRYTFIVVIIIIIIIIIVFNTIITITIITIITIIIIIIIIIIRIRNLQDEYMSGNDKVLPDIKELQQELSGLKQDYIDLVGGGSNLPIYFGRTEPKEPPESFQ